MRPPWSALSPCRRVWPLGLREGALKQLGGQPNHHTPPPHRTTARMAVDQRAAEEDRLRAKWSDPVAAAAAGAQVRPPTQC